MNKQETIAPNNETKNSGCNKTLQTRTNTCNKTLQILEAGDGRPPLDWGTYSINQQDNAFDADFADF